MPQEPHSASFVERKQQQEQRAGCSACHEYTNAQARPKFHASAQIIARGIDFDKILDLTAAVFLKFSIMKMMYLVPGSKHVFFSHDTV